MTEVKPICVIYFLPELLQPDNTIKELTKVFQHKLYDYHIICCPSQLSEDGSCENVRLQVFHPKSFTEIQFEELKTLVLTEFDNLK